MLHHSRKFSTSVDNWLNLSVRLESSVAVWLVCVVKAEERWLRRVVGLGRFSKLETRVFNLEVVSVKSTERRSTRDNSCLNSDSICVVKSEKVVIGTCVFTLHGYRSNFTGEVGKTVGNCGEFGVCMGDKV